MAAKTIPILPSKDFDVRFDTAAQARALHEAWAPRIPSRGTLHPPVETDYGLLEFALLDPHGNLLRIGGPRSV